MSRLRRMRRGLGDDTGAAAVEFALVLPAFLALTIGTIYVSILMLSVADLQSAVEEAARCASVRTAVCTDQGTVAAYAVSRYGGPGIDPVFTYALADCGHQVTATATFQLVTGMPAASVPITVTACHP